LNYVPHAQADQARHTQKHHIFAPTAGALSFISPKLCMVIDDVVSILKGANHYSIQHMVFPTGAKMLIFGVNLMPWQPASNDKLVLADVRLKLN